MLNKIRKGVTSLCIVNKSNPYFDILKDRYKEFKENIVEKFPVEFIEVDNRVTVVLSDAGTEWFQITRGKGNSVIVSISSYCSSFESTDESGIYYDDFQINLINSIGISNFDFNFVKVYGKKDMVELIFNNEKDLAVFEFHKSQWLKKLLEVTYEFLVKMSLFTSINDDIESYDENSTVNKTMERHISTLKDKDIESILKKIENNLDLNVENKSRREQGILRRYLFRDKRIGKCGICQKEFPINFLVTAHIKKRSECQLEEKIDFRNIVMPMCKFGCDDLFEKGYISVVDGIVVSMKHKNRTPSIDEIISNIEGKKCPYWNKTSKKYFEWHYKFHLSNNI